MASLSWTPQFQNDGTVLGVIVVRDKHTLRVTVKYDTTSFDIDYLSSVNLKYKEVNGVKKLHPHGNGWMANLNNAILVNLQLECENSWELSYDRVTNLVPTRIPVIP